MYAAGMQRREKLRILLIQLPPPNFSFGKKWGNTPIAASYFKALAFKEGLLDEADIEILNPIDTNISSDSRLIELITSKSPHVVGFTLYLWNVQRSLFVAEQVKKELPGIKVIVGGPEVTMDNEWLLDKAAVDVGCIGEGELTFLEIVKNYLAGGEDHANINGIFYRKSGEIFVNDPSTPLVDLDQIPSPYALGYINPKDYVILGYIAYEGIRGCPFKCAYCKIGTIPVRRFSVERICEDLKIIMKSGRRGVRFIDSNFLLRPDFYELCANIKEINRDRKLEFSAFIYAEHLNPEKAELLKECNFAMVETGLQTIKDETLQNINRHVVDQSKFLTGIKLLEEREIRCEVDVIVGLPRDRADDVLGTVRFLNDNKITRFTMPRLSVLPGTTLRQEASKYNLRFQDRPPYYIIDAPYITREEIESSINTFRQHDRELKSITEPLITETIRDSIMLQRLVSQNSEQLRNIQKIKQANGLYRHIVVDLNTTGQSIDRMNDLGKDLTGRLYQPFTLLLKNHCLEKSLPLIEALVSPVAEANPYLVWNVILETDNTFHRGAVAKMERITATNEIFTNIARLIPASRLHPLLQWANAREETLWLNELGTLPFSLSMDISNDPGWEEEIEALSEMKNTYGIFVGFDPTAEPDLIREALCLLRKRFHDRLDNVCIKSAPHIQLDSVLDALRSRSLDEVSDMATGVFTLINSQAPGSILFVDKNLNLKLL